MYHCMIFLWVQMFLPLSVICKCTSTSTHSRKEECRLYKWLLLTPVWRQTDGWWAAPVGPSPLDLVAPPHKAGYFWLGLFGRQLWHFCEMLALCSERLQRAVSIYKQTASFLLSYYSVFVLLKTIFRYTAKIKYCGIIKISGGSIFVEFVGTSHPQINILHN